MGATVPGSHPGISGRQGSAWNPARPLQTATGNLERVRKVKTRHQRLFSRVTAVREELQRFLEDDDDMVKMCLTRKRELEQAANQSGAGGEHCTRLCSPLLPSSLRLGWTAIHLGALPAACEQWQAACAWTMQCPQENRKQEL